MALQAWQPGTGRISNIVWCGSSRPPLHLSVHRRNFCALCRDRDSRLPSYQRNQILAEANVIEPILSAVLLCRAGSSSSLSSDCVQPLSIYTVGLGRRIATPSHLLDQHERFFTLARSRPAFTPQCTHLTLRRHRIAPIMVYLFSGLLNWLRSLFFAKHLEVTIVGLQVRVLLVALTECFMTDDPPLGIGQNIVSAVSITRSIARNDTDEGHRLVNVLGSDQWSEDVVPTVAFNLRQVRKGNVTMKVWDVAGQPKFRGMWDRYCRGADAIVLSATASPREQERSPRRDRRRRFDQGDEIRRDQRSGRLSELALGLLFWPLAQPDAC
uniref:Uncharacterized protein n=1 Tax=Solanum lycopersicum TaxID=4081 RepID=A0A494G905_SOLLC